MCAGAISVLVYMLIRKPDLIIEKVSLLPSGMSVTIKNVGKKDAIGKIYLCIADKGAEKHANETTGNFTCGHESLVNLDPKGTQGELLPIKAGESFEAREQTDAYIGPLYISIDKANEPELNNLVREFSESNNLYIMK